MRSLVVGLGSIGERHLRLLGELGASPAAVSRRGGSGVFASLAEALAAHRPELVIIAVETGAHHQVLAALAESGYRGRVLVEKPLFDAWRALPANAFGDLRVAYNLRCHPLIAALRHRLAGRPLLVQAAVGQYLPDWRPGRAWRQGYSADPARGGGALRDLSHELDLLLWLLGPWRRVAAVGGRSGLLPIASDDHWSILLAFEGGASASLQLDYLSRPGRRFLAVEHSGGSLVADFVAGTLAANASLAKVAAHRDDSYRALLARMLAGDTAGLCDAQGGLAVMGLIAGIERAAREGSWVSAVDAAAATGSAGGGQGKGAANP
jgi:predicted dehydrogenase